MRKLLYFIFTLIFIFLISSCSHTKSYDGKPSPFSQNYDTYEEMILDYKKLNPQYEDIYLDSLSEFNPTYYCIHGMCNCKNKSDNTLNGESRCPNFKEVYPGISFNDKSGNRHELCFFYNVENINIDQLEFGPYNKDLKIDLHKLNPARNTYYLSFDNVPIFSVSMNDSEIIELLKENLKKHYNI